MAKKCKICKQPFTPRFKTTQPTCENYECILKHSKEVKAKEWNKTKKIKKERLKTKQDYLKELQVVFNKYIRLRDKEEPCISCSRPLGTKYDAGHYRSVGSCPELRFEENNVNAQCVYCNQHLHGNLINYRMGIIERFGLAVVDWLEINHEPKHYTIPELKEMKEYYKKKIKEL